MADHLRSYTGLRAEDGDRNDGHEHAAHVRAIWILVSRVWRVGEQGAILALDDEDWQVRVRLTELGRELVAERAIDTIPEPVAAFEGIVDRWLGKFTTRLSFLQFSLDFLWQAIVELSERVDRPWDLRVVLAAPNVHRTSSSVQVHTPLRPMHFSPTSRMSSAAQTLLF